MSRLNSCYSSIIFDMLLWRSDFIMPIIYHKEIFEFVCRSAVLSVFQQPIFFHTIYELLHTMVYSVQCNGPEFLNSSNSSAKSLRASNCTANILASHWRIYSVERYPDLTKNQQRTRTLFMIISIPIFSKDISVSYPYNSYFHWIISHRLA